MICKLNSPWWLFCDLIPRLFRPCGSTVGPLLSQIGVRTVDVGAPMLSMHSIRETAGAHDVQATINLFKSLFEGFSEFDKNLTVD